MSGSWTSALLGGLLIGVASASLLVLQGRVAGISGAVSSVLTGPRDVGKTSFLGGLLAGALTLAWLAPQWLQGPVDRSLGLIAAAGLVVGFGTRMGNGCTSGHGVCGVGRLSRRSIAATAVFLLTGGLVATAVAVWQRGG